MISFRAVIELWPSREAMAAELGARPQAVSKWFQRDNIPSGWWAAIISSERARSAGVTGDVLTMLAGGQASSATRMAKAAIRATKGVAQEVPS